MVHLQGQTQEPAHSQSSLEDSSPARSHDSKVAQLCLEAVLSEQARMRNKTIRTSKVEERA